MTGWETARLAVGFHYTGLEVLVEKSQEKAVVFIHSFVVYLQPYKLKFSLYFTYNL